MRYQIKNRVFSLKLLRTLQVIILIFRIFVVNFYLINVPLINIHYYEEDDCIRGLLALSTVHCVLWSIYML